MCDWPNCNNIFVENNVNKWVTTNSMQLRSKFSLFVRVDYDRQNNPKLALHSSVSRLRTGMLSVLFSRHMISSVVWKTYSIYSSIDVNGNYRTPFMSELLWIQTIDVFWITGTAVRHRSSTTEHMLAVASDSPPPPEQINKSERNTSSSSDKGIEDAQNVHFTPAETRYKQRHPPIYSKSYSWSILSYSYSFWARGSFVLCRFLRNLPMSSLKLFRLMFNQALRIDF